MSNTQPSVTRFISQQAAFQGRLWLLALMLAMSSTGLMAQFEYPVAVSSEANSQLGRTDRPMLREVQKTASADETVIFQLSSNQYRALKYFIAGGCVTLIFILLGSMLRVGPSDATEASLPHSGQNPIHPVYPPPFANVAPPRQVGQRLSGEEQQFGDSLPTNASTPYTLPFGYLPTIPIGVPMNWGPQFSPNALQPTAETFSQGASSSVSTVSRSDLVDSCCEVPGEPDTPKQSGFASELDPVQSGSGKKPANESDRDASGVAPASEITSTEDARTETHDAVLGLSSEGIIPLAVSSLDREPIAADECSAVDRLKTNVSGTNEKPVAPNTPGNSEGLAVSDCSEQSNAQTDEVASLSDDGNDQAGDSDDDSGNEMGYAAGEDYPHRRLPKHGTMPDTRSIFDAIVANTIEVKSLAS